MKKYATADEYSLEFKGATRHSDFPKDRKFSEKDSLNYE